MYAAIFSGDILRVGFGEGGKRRPALHFVAPAGQHGVGFLFGIEVLELHGKLLPASPGGTVPLCHVLLIILQELLVGGRLRISLRVFVKPAAG